MGKRGPKPKFNDVACPNAKCSCYGVAGKGNVTSNGTSKIKSGGQVRKFICSACGLVFCSRKNTVFYGLRTSPEKITLALDLSTKGLSVNKIAEVVKVCPVTVRKWTGKGTCSIGCGGLAQRKKLGQPWHRVAPRYNIPNILEIANPLFSACVEDRQLILPSDFACFASRSVADLPLDHAFPHSYL